MSEFRDSFSQQQDYNNALAAYHQSLNRGLAKSAYEYQKAREDADEKIAGIKEGLLAGAAPFFHEGVKGGIQRLTKQAADKVREVGEETFQKGVTRAGELIKSQTGKMADRAQQFASDVQSRITNRLADTKSAIEDAAQKGVQGVENTINNGKALLSSREAALNERFGGLAGDAQDAVMARTDAERTKLGQLIDANRPQAEIDAAQSRLQDATEDAIRGVTDGAGEAPLKDAARSFDDIVGKAGARFTDYSDLVPARPTFDSEFGDNMLQTPRQLGGSFYVKPVEKPEFEDDDLLQEPRPLYQESGFGLEINPMANKSDALTNDDLGNKVRGVFNDETADALTDNAVANTEEGVASASKAVTNVAGKAADATKSIGGILEDAGEEAAEADAAGGGVEDPFADLVSLGVGLAGIIGGLLAKPHDPTPPHIPRPSNPVSTVI